MKQCPKCKMTQQDWEEGSYCYLCGEALIRLHCEYCEQSLYPVDIYCPNCGKEVAVRK